MADAAHKRATYADLVALPDNVVGEILDGELHVSPRPASRHARVSSVLGRSIGGPFDYDPGGPGGWLILDEPELHLGAEPDVVVPDLAGWRRERMPEMPDAAAFTLAPDWVCEVLSPSTAARDRTVKMEIHARERVGHLWLVDPDARLLEVFRLAQWLRVGSWSDEARVRPEPFDAIELDLAVLWSR
jgi:Uma2 family endonuclease